MLPHHMRNRGLASSNHSDCGVRCDGKSSFVRGERGTHSNTELQVGLRVRFGLKFVKTLRADFGPAYKFFFRNDGHFCRQLLLKQSS